MTRAHVTALALVNWKGVFYERYRLDRHVTALEGSNGAGKTTVMIAAYVVLLPDMSRLRFTNVGESGATGGDRGIWGRLGESGRPAYAALDIALADGVRVVAAVRLRRLSEPTVEPTAFLIEGLAAETQLSQLFLLRSEDRDQVCELDEIKAAVQSAGAKIEVFRTIKDYFAALFERGITPLRLATEEERNKQNEMLRTSMTGGISRVLTSELRSFLLKEEAGLGDVLARMRQNLDACRQTRTEVAEARVVERDISGVYEAGQAMFSAALHAARAASEETAGRVDAAHAALHAAASASAELAAEAAELTAREAAWDERLASARTRVAELTTELERARAASALGAKLQMLDAELTSLDQAAERSRELQAAAVAERGARRAQVEQLQEAYRRAALGLGHLQEGLDELHRRAHAHRTLGQRLSEARALLALPELTLEQIPHQLAEQHAARETLRAEQARHERARDGAGRHREEFRRAEAALAQIEAALAAANGGETNRLTRARQVLAQLATLDAESTRLPTLELEAGESARLATRQTAARARAAALGIASDAGASEPQSEANSSPTGESVDLTADAMRTRARDARGDDANRAHALAADANHDGTHARGDGADRAHDGAAVFGSLALARRIAGAEVSLREVEARSRSLETRLVATTSARTLARERRSQLHERALRWQSVIAAVQRASQALGIAAISVGDLADAREQLAAETLELSATRQATVTERENALRLAAELDGPGAALDPELVRLRDELGAELLLERFDDIAPEDAASMQARLGPLAHALMVSDPHAAAVALLDQPRTLETVWFVRTGVDLEGFVLGTGTEDIVVAEKLGARISRKPAQPTLGAGARTARAAQLRQRASEAGDELEQLSLRLRQLAGVRRDLDLLASQQTVLSAGDPAAELSQLELEEAPLAAAEQAARDELAQARERAASARSELEELHRLSSDATLLDPPDHAERASALTERVSHARRLLAQLAELRPARTQLSELLGVLDQPPLDDTALERASDRVLKLTAALELNYRAVAALEDVLAHAHASGWQDAAEALASQASLMPVLEAQNAAARDALAGADRAVIEADARWERQTATAQADAAARAAAVAQRERLVLELAALGGKPMDAQLMAAEQALAEATARTAELERDAKSGVAELARTRERVVQAAQRQRAAEASLRTEQQRAAPITDAFRQLWASADAAGLLADTPDADATAVSSATLAAEVSSRRALLEERLARSRGGEQAARDVHAATGPNAVVDAWQLARDWLRRRIPVQVANDDDPLLAMLRLRDHLDVLEGRLARQESDLRYGSEDVARGIDVQVRRARGQVRRLNAHMEGVRFGSIAAIRVEMRRVDRMEQILRALREGDAQELLFLPSIPIEEALEEIFRRYGGGGRLGGQRLLDYREYVELVVEIKRQTGETWEAASPTRLSTGEAIGVGAALMMVVLTEWERDSNLLRARSHPGSLRFLFLDEANRLSRDNLGVLFELCKNLDLQLMIAAPEVARAEGNTTYRLVRHITEAGHEEVIVSGRRARADVDAVVTGEDVETPTLQ